MKKRIIIGILIAALVAGGSAGGATYYKKSHQKTVSVVSVDNLAGQYYMDDTNLDGNIVTSAIQNITVDKDMIIQEVYVSKGDEVKKDDKLISFDMTLVQMELNIAKLKQQQQEQERRKQVARKCQRAGDAAGQRTQGAPEYRVADTGQRAHQTSLDRVDGVGVKVLLCGVLLLHGRCNAEDKGAEHGRGVEELGVTLQCLAQLLLVRIQLL